MDKQRLIIIISALVVISGVVLAYFLYINPTSMPSDKGMPSKMNSKDIGSLEEKCVITVRGSKYDVSEFRNKHKGGNIFKCNEDMTEAFNKQHGEKQFNELQKYKIE